jgi:hypothetical protein
MSILANLMPGVRAVRAPLAAGFLLLLSLWLMVDESVPRHPSDGIWASLNRLSPLATAFGTVGIVTFAAYVAGSLYIVAIGIAGQAAKPRDQRQTAFPPVVPNHIFR